MYAVKRHSMVINIFIGTQLGDTELLVPKGPGSQT